MYTGIPQVQLGALVSNTWSVGGPGNNSPDNHVNELAIQPVFNYHFGKGWYTGVGDLAFVVDWEHDNDIYAPLSLRLGKVYAIMTQHMESNIQGIYNVGDKVLGRDRWGIKATVSLLFPE
jgi:hypothetical protein